MEESLDHFVDLVLTILNQMIDAVQFIAIYLRKTGKDRNNCKVKASLVSFDWICDDWRHPRAEHEITFITHIDAYRTLKLSLADAINDCPTLFNS